MEIFWFLLGMFLGAVVGAGLVILYVKRQFARSMGQIEEQMEMIQDLEKD